MSDNEDDIFHNSDDNDSVIDSEVDSDEDNNYKASKKKELSDVDFLDNSDDESVDDDDDDDDDEDNEEPLDDDKDNIQPNIVGQSQEISMDGPEDEIDYTYEDNKFSHNENYTDNSDEEDDEDEEDENYLQKFDTEIKKNYITEYHPECFVHNNEEINTLAKIIRNKDNIIIDPLHHTLPFLTKYERTRVLGQRAKQINAGAKAFVKIPENIIDGHLIAELELAQKRIPFIIRRPLPGNGSEYWHLKDLELISF